MPLFFFLSGWIINRNCGKNIINKQYIKKKFANLILPFFEYRIILVLYWYIVEYRFRLLVIYVCWSIFYLPMIVENWPGRSALHNLLSFIRHYIFGYSMQMWYVPSTIVGTIIVVLSLKYLKNIIAWLIAMLLFVFGLSCSGYANIFQNQFSELWLRYFFSVALIRAPIYIMLGLYTTLRIP